MVGDICLDKDGIRGAAVFAELAIYLNKKEGITCNQHLQNLYQK